MVNTLSLTCSDAVTSIRLSQCVIHTADIYLRMIHNISNTCTWPAFQWEYLLRGNEKLIIHCMGNSQKQSSLSREFILTSWLPDKTNNK